MRWSWLVLVALNACTRADGETDADGDADADADADADTDADADADTDVPAEPELVTIAFAATDDDFPNPERGLYDHVDLVRGGDFSDVRAAGRTLAYAGVHLDEWRDAPLDAALLSDLDAGFADVRAAGIKVILRFVYNDGLDEGDASKARILAHLEQLAPVLAANADVIAVVQAGFIGAWGEWHASTNGLDNPTDRAEILAAIVAAVPPSRMTQVRTPMFKDEAYGGPITDGFDGSDAARVGHHNDCFLASTSDFGTYETPIETWKDFVAAEGRFTPVGGETCAVNASRTDCPEATAELERLHWSYLNALYHPDVLAGWSDQGCLDDVSRRLGYRFELVDAAHSERVAPGGILHVQVTVRNVGYAALFNARPVVVVLGSETAAIDVDPRLWEPGTPMTLNVRLRVPADLVPGTHRLALRLPDPLLADDAYAIRFANEGVWQAPDNVLTELVVDPDAPGDVDPAATDLEPL